MKKFKSILALLLALVMLLSMAACGGNTDDNGGNDGNVESTGVGNGDGGEDGGNDDGGSAEVEYDAEDEDLLGITDTTIYVGNTAGITGALATIGEPFNVGIQAAFAAYNAAGGYKGLNVELVNYDDEGDAAQSVTLMEKLVYDDEVFAIVGNFGSYAVAANLDILIDEGVPMVYAAAGNDVLYNGDAEGNEKAIFPVQPLNHTEGQMMILRAFAPTDMGGMGATKVGVLTNNDEASQSMLEGIKEEAEHSALTDKIVYQNVAGDDFSAAINAFKSAGCDTVVIAVTGSYFTNALKAMANANFYAVVLTSYNNASTTALNGTDNKLLEEYYDVMANIPIFAQAWLDTSSTEYYYNNEGGLLDTYTILGMTNDGAGVAGFTESYWSAAEDIYNYCISAGRADGFAMSYNSYALAGYIAGDLFCQGLKALEEKGVGLTRENYIKIMESQDYQIAMADSISFADGMRSGVQSFALTMFYDYYSLDAEYGGGQYHQALSTTVYPLTSIEEYRAMLAE